MGEKSITLLELQKRLEHLVDNLEGGPFWIRAEIGNVNANNNGHCYLELVEKDSSGTLTVRVNAMIWANTWRLLRPYFESVVSCSLQEGMQILVCVSPRFHALYGMSLTITDIDPSYSLGAIVLERKKVIARLIADGVYEMNRDLSFPRLPRRIAVISAKTAAGFGDFQKHLSQSGYGFKTVLFEAYVQGREAPKSIIEALESIDAKEFDIVVLIRGGGSSADLSCFDDYDLCANLAQFNLPLLTGIGHDRDEHVADMVAHTALKTPTAVADYLISIFHEEELALDRIAQRIQGSLLMIKERRRQVLDRLEQQLSFIIQNRLLQEKHRIDILEQRVASCPTLEILNRGYAIVSKNGKRLYGASGLNAGEEVVISWAKDGLCANVRELIDYQENK